MDNYCTLSIGKVKSYEAMNQVYEHNHRFKEVMNADPELTVDNEILINKEERPFSELYNETIENEYTQNRKIRKDAVKGFEIIVSFSHGAEKNLDLDKWVEDNIKFIADNFGGMNNIKDAVLHMDEATPHIHFFVVPMIDGQLNAKNFVNSRASLIQLQDKYGEAMKVHNLKRGKKGSFLKHNDVRQFYAELGEVLGDELPPPEESENIRSYYERMNEMYKKTMLAKLKEKQEQARTLNEKYQQRLERYVGLEEFRQEAKRTFGSVKKATEKLREKYYEEMALEATALGGEAELHSQYQETLDVMQRTGKVYVKAKEKAEQEREKDGRG